MQSCQQTIGSQISQQRREISFKGDENDNDNDNDDYDGSQHNLELDDFRWSTTSWDSISMLLRFLSSSTFMSIPRLHNDLGSRGRAFGFSDRHHINKSSYQCARITES